MGMNKFVGKCYIHNREDDGTKHSIRKIVSCVGNKLYYDVLYYKEPFAPDYFPAKDFDNAILIGAHEVAVEIGYLIEITEDEYEKIKKEKLEAA